MIQIADINLSAVVTRSGLTPPLTPLDLDDNEKFVLGRGARVGSVVWRREAATSPYVHGRIPVHEVKDAAECQIGVFVLGATNSVMNANLQELLRAFTEQYQYDLTLVTNGVVQTWRCERADYEVGFVTEALVARVLPVQLSFHRSPVPLQGAF